MPACSRNSKSDGLASEIHYITLLYVLVCDEKLFIPLEFDQAFKGNDNCNLDLAFQL